MIKLETINKCYLCGSEKLKPYAEVKSYFTESTDLPDTFVLSKCTNCGLLLLSTRPVIDDIGAYYLEDSNYYLQADVIDINKGRKENMKKVLDVGFGNAKFLIDKYKEGWECYGSDISNHAVKKGTDIYPMLDLRQGTLQECKFEADYFDMVSLHHVLEHDYDPIALIKEVRRIVKPGGSVQVDVPNYGGLYYKIFKKRAEYFVPHHLSFFTNTTLGRVFDDAGFSDYSIIDIFGNNTSYQILHMLGIQKSYYKKTIFNKFLGLGVWPLEMIFQKGDSLRAFLKK